MRARALALVAALAVAAAGCASGGGRAPGEDAAQLASVMVGSDRVLDAGEVDAVQVIGLELVTLAAPLTEWWDTYHDPAVDPATWVGDAPARLAAMRAAVDHLAAQLGPGRDPAVRATFAPYVTQWRAILVALDDLAGATGRGDRARAERAVDAYNVAAGAIASYDAARVARVVEAYGPAEARRALLANGEDPARFGL